MSIATAITYKEQGAGTPEAKDSWFIEYDDKAPELTFVNPNTLAIFNESLLYQKRRFDGVNAFLLLTSEFMLNGMPRNQVQFIEKKLDPVTMQVVNGQWISALEDLDLISPTGHLTQEIYDRIHLSISTYIANNY